MIQTGRHKRTTLSLLACLFVVCLAIGCTEKDNAGNTPVPQSNGNGEPAPTPPPEKSTSRWDAWMQDDPFKLTMRQMWIDCGQIIANAGKPGLEDRWLLHYSATALSRKTERMAQHFENLRNANRASALAARQGDWAAAIDQLSIAHRTCGECHFDYWTLGAREYVPGTMQGWLANQDVYTDEPWGKQEFISAPSVRLTMVKLRDAMEKAEVAVEANDLDALMAATEVIHKFADKQFGMWDGIRQRADTIARLADENKLHLVGEQYRKLAGYCRDCHESSSDGRGLNPLPWGPGE